PITVRLKPDLTPASIHRRLSDDRTIAKRLAVQSYDSIVGRIAAVVFDFDGIVLDSETPEYESHRRIYERCGVPLTVADWCEAIGVWNEGHVDRRFETLRSRSRDAPPLDEYVAERQRIFQMLLPLRPMRGIHELLLALEAAGIPAAIAS